MFIGDAQFLFARGELARHVVERGGKRLEFGEPGLLRRAHVQIAAAETRCGAHQRPDRPHDELLAAEPGDQKNEHAEQRELQIGDADFAVDAAVHGLLIEADGKPRLRPGHADISEDAPDAVEARGRHRAFVVCEHVLHQACPAKRLPIRFVLSAEAATSVPLPSISSTEAPERCAAVAARSPIHCRLIDARTTPLTEPSSLMAGKVANRLGIWCIRLIR